MTPSPASIVPAIRATRSRLFRVLSLVAVLSTLSGALFAQTNPTPTADTTPEADAATKANGRVRRNQNGGNFDPAQMQEQMMTRLREQFAVTDDAEWKLITDRITAVTELRRAAGGGFGGLAGGFGGGRGGQAGQGGGGGGGQGGARAGRGATASPEQDALRQAVTDKLPDAEVKTRLARLREVRKANEEKLTKAQENLRAVLDVRQEAVAVMAGLLP
jgi:hypothetical protein